MSNPEKSSGSAPQNAVPEGYATVTPWIISRDTGKLIDFMSAAFGAVEIARVVDEKGVIGHAEVRIGDSVVMGFDARPDWPDTPAFLRLYVGDCDAVYEQAPGRRRYVRDPADLALLRRSSSSRTRSSRKSVVDSDAPRNLVDGGDGAPDGLS
jgi:hypothetical protein